MFGIHSSRRPRFVPSSSGSELIGIAPMPLSQSRKHFTDLMRGFGRNSSMRLEQGRVGQFRILRIDEAALRPMRVGRLVALLACQLLFLRGDRQKVIAVLVRVLMLPRKLRS